MSPAVTPRRGISIGCRDARIGSAWVDVGAGTFELALPKQTVRLILK